MKTINIGFVKVNTETGRFCMNVCFAKVDKANYGLYTSNTVQVLKWVFCGSNPWPLKNGALPMIDFSTSANVWKSLERGWTRSESWLDDMLGVVSTLAVNVFWLGQTLQVVREKHNYSCCSCTPNTMKRNILDKYHWITDILSSCFQLCWRYPGHVAQD